MKITRKIIGLVMICVMAGWDGFAQPKVLLNAKRRGNSICLRWAVSDRRLWEALVRSGGVLEKYCFDLRAADKEPDREVFRIPAVSSMDSNYIKVHKEDEYLNMLAEIVWGQKLEIGWSNSNISWTDLSYREEEAEMRYAMAMMVLDQSFETACFANMGKIDKEVDENSVYLYRFYLQDTSVRGDTALCYIRMNARPLYPPLQPLEVQEFSRGVRLAWSLKHLEGITAFHVEKKIKKDFVRVNRHPVVPFTTDPTSKMYYNDSLGDGEKCIYRVIGQDVYGDERIVTEEAFAKSYTEIQSKLIILGVEETDEDEVSIFWSFDSKEEPLLRDFLLYKKTDMYAAYEIVAPVKARQRKYKISKDQLSPSVYFQILANGKRGERIYSNVYFYQQKDSVPPAAPTLYFLPSDSTGHLCLRWKPSASKDVAGYRVFKAVGRKAEFVQLTSDPILDTVFQDTVYPGTSVSVYYKVKAVDYTGNESDFSEAMEVCSPFPNPPSPAIFSDCEAISTRLVLRWKPAEDEAVCMHKLFERGSDSSVKLLAIFSGEEGKSVDSFLYQLPPEEWSSSPRIFDIVSYTSGRDSTRTPFPYVYNPVLQWKPEPLELYAYREERRIGLQWNESEFQRMGVKRMLIYRGEEDQPMQLYRTLLEEEIAKGLYLDDRVKMNRVYVYKIQCELQNGKWCEYSDESKLMY